MADVQYENFALRSNASCFDAFWKLTRAIKKAGGVYKASSDGVAKDTTGTATNDKWGGSADPSSDTYAGTINGAGNNLDAAVCWWCCVVNSTFKIGMTVAPVAGANGDFIPGEKVTQAGSGAVGEYVGHDFDTVAGNNGHAVLLLRTGAFDNTGVVTGAASGATFTATSVEEFVAEIVITKAGNLTTGSVYMQRVSVQNENASRFSVLAGSAGCTATVAPGGGGTGNSFPAAGSWVVKGVQTGTPSHASWWPNVSSLGKAQICCVDLTATASYSPDGTFWIVQGDPGVSATQAQLFGYFRCVDAEPGDVDPFVSCCPSSTGYNNANIRLTAAVGSSINSTSNSQLFAGTLDSVTTWRGFRRRGWATGDAYSGWATGQYYSSSNFGTNGMLHSINPSIAEAVACSYTTKRVRDRFVLHAMDAATAKGRKGSPRWLWVVQGGSTYDTFDTKTKMVLFPSSAGNLNGGMAIGPLDGSTVPVQN